MHQTISAAAGYRKSLEGYARAGIKYVEVVLPQLEPFVKTDGMLAARKLLSDLGLTAVSFGSGARGLWEPNPDRSKAIETMKRAGAVAAELGIDRLVCPSAAAEKYTADDYKRGVDNMREAGEIARQIPITLMVEFMRGSTFLGTLPTSLRLTREAAHPNVRPMFDCYHFWAGLSKFEDLESIRPGEIWHVHFQDVPDIPREILDNTKCREKASLRYPASCVPSPRKAIPARCPSSSSTPVIKTRTLTKWPSASARRLNP
jgi:sugar phosphate isomerase/epimerase